MLTRRIIPCLDVAHGRVVKGIRFSGLRDAGDPVERARAYQQQGGDELVVLDVAATVEARAHHLQVLRDMRHALMIPLTAGGGVKGIDDAAALLEAGADKVAVNTAAVERPELLVELAERFGRQCVVVAIDARRLKADAPVPGAPVPDWEVVIRAGTTSCGRDALEWAEEATTLGAGEILLTSWDRDGTRLGYDLELITAVHARVGTPIIASGGAATVEHLAEAFAAGADAVLAASIFHDHETTVSQIKDDLHQLGIEVRR
ncbi:MAG: imidazole glycerol phosphate synthase subunit HisF [Deltaproteobacteria bacterium]|nr:imidazole glycerol phosphate synthase subunit HisF [Deltaproteobacteria bacterium]